jgi:hypothetical protein
MRSTIPLNPFWLLWSASWLPTLFEYVGIWNKDTKKLGNIRNFLVSPESDSKINLPLSALKIQDRR